jgi:hypothetical protein
MLSERAVIDVRVRVERAVLVLLPVGERLEGEHAARIEGVQEPIRHGEIGREWKSHHVDLRINAA